VAPALHGRSLSAYRSGSECDKSLSKAAAALGRKGGAAMRAAKVEGILPTTATSQEGLRLRVKPYSLQALRRAFHRTRLGQVLRAWTKGQILR
jgi:hypothetical protein